MTSHQLFKALLSAAEHRDSPDAIKRALTMIDEGGKDLLMNFDYIWISPNHLLVHAMLMDVPLEVIHRMIDIGGKDFLLKNDSWTPLHQAFKVDSTLNFQLVPKLLEVGGRDLVMKKYYSGQTALHVAFDQFFNRLSDHNRAKVMHLIEFGGKKLVMAKDSVGETVLHYARFLKTSNIVIKKMIDVGGRDLLEETNFHGELAVQKVAFTDLRQYCYRGYKDPDYYISHILALLVREGMKYNIGGEFSFGGLLVGGKIWRISEYRWYDRLFPRFKKVYRIFQLESPNKIPPLLHSMIIKKAPKFVIRDLLYSCDGMVSVTDTSGRFAIDVAIEENLPYDEGMKEIFDVSAEIYGLDLALHQVAYRGLSWNNGMEELVLENLDKALNGVNKKTGLKLFMTAANGGDLDTIYNLISINPMGLFD